MSEANISALFNCHKAPFRSYSNSLLPEMEMTPPFSCSLSAAAKRQVHKPSWNLKFLPTNFPTVSFFCKCVATFVLHTHTDIFVSYCWGVSTERTRKTEGKKETDVARWSHYDSHLMHVSVRDIAAGGHTMKSTHNCSLQPFLKPPFTDPKKVMITVYGKTEKRGQFKNDKKANAFLSNFYKSKIAHHASQWMQNN